MSNEALAAAVRLISGAVENIGEYLIDTEASHASLSDEDADLLTDLLAEFPHSFQLADALEALLAALEDDEDEDAS